MIATAHWSGWQAGRQRFFGVLKNFKYDSQAIEFKTIYYDYNNANRAALVTAK